jgi:hypothetical protein
MIVGYCRIIEDPEYKGLSQFRERTWIWLERNPPPPYPAILQSCNPAKGGRERCLTMKAGLKKCVHNSILKHPIKQDGHWGVSRDQQVTLCLCSLLGERWP